MFQRLKAVLVRSYVGAIALGWIFGEAMLRLATFLTWPFDIWLGRQISSSVHIALADEARFAIPRLTTSLALLLLGYLLLRWLYYSPPKEATRLVREPASGAQDSPC